MKTPKELSLKGKDFHISTKRVVVIQNKPLNVACTTIAFEVNDPNRNCVTSNLKSVVVSEAIGPVNTQDDQLSGTFVYLIQ